MGTIGFKKDGGCRPHFVEPSVSLPLIAGYAMKKKAAKYHSRLSVKWDGDPLKEMKVVKKKSV